MFFKHFLGEHGFHQLSIARLDSPPPASQLWLLDAGYAPAEALSEFITQCGEQTPIALVNIAEGEAEWLVDKHPIINGVFYSNATREQLLAGIQVLLEGGDWLPRPLMERLLGQLRQMRQVSANKASLTLREREILSLASKGLSNAEIAAQLNLSPHTIKSHVHNLLRKIGASNRAEAAFLLRNHLDWPEPCNA
ncbi:helix-turn-helix transcriptional regulator [Stutzerimonas tarimensis]|uniref:LuxR C-terminal-related transcriptional regulator n=1 Tax=Stutzerimonas tarimensis TaxID=1507735 RepID=A0ABV7T3M3_9GAMM